MEFKRYIEWDVLTWSRALKHWKVVIDNKVLHSNAMGLDIGGRDGGLSLFFTELVKVKIVCSDLNGPSEKARTLLHKYTQNGQVEYANVNALNIDFPNNNFDFVVFKSVIGSLANDKFENQKKAIAEMHRVLKPGGILFFAENLKASYFHQFGRKHFIPWGIRWRYISKNEMLETLQSFDHYSIKYTGFFAAFIPNKYPTLKKVCSRIDRIFDPIIPNSCKYVAYGHAIK